VASDGECGALLNELRDSWSGKDHLYRGKDEVVFGENGAAYRQANIHLYGDGLICGEGQGTDGWPSAKGALGSSWQRRAKLTLLLQKRADRRPPGSQRP
jgi:hypothetical protein